MRSERLSVGRMALAVCFKALRSRGGEVFRLAMQNESLAVNNARAVAVRGRLRRRSTICVWCETRGLGYAPLWDNVLQQPDELDAEEFLANARMWLGLARSS